MSKHSGLYILPLYFRWIKFNGKFNDMTEASFQELLLRNKESGITVRDFCSNEGLTQATYYYSKNKLNKKSIPPSEFIQLFAVKHMLLLVQPDSRITAGIDFSDFFRRRGKITGMNSRASPGPISRRKQQGIIPSDFVGIACLDADRFD